MRVMGCCYAVIGLNIPRTPCKPPDRARRKAQCWASFNHDFVYQYKQSKRLEFVNNGELAA